MEKAESIIEKKSDLFEIFKLIDQFKIMKKLILNENQYFLLKEIEKPTILYDNNQKKSIKDLEDLKERKYNCKKANLNKYLELNKEKNTFTLADTLILKYANRKVEDLEDFEGLDLEAKDTESINSTIQKI